VKALKFAALIAAYNEEKALPGLLARLPCDRKDIVIIDDGSADRTAIIAEESGCVVIRQERNMGKGAAHRAGFEYLMTKDYDGVITMDADGQHDPSLIPLFLKKAESGGYDILVGTRKLGRGTGMPLIRLLTNIVTSLVVSILSGEKIRDSQSGYRFLSISVIRRVPLETNRYQTESEVLMNAGRLGYSIGEIPISTIYSGQKSNINKLLDTMRFVRLCVKNLWR
jgi:glycosyltransferase involved in cell wall biosynthesis